MASLTQTQHKWIGLTVTRLERVGTLLFMILRVTKTKKNKTIAPPKGLQRHGEEDDIPKNADFEGHGQDQDQEGISANNGLGKLRMTKTKKNKTIPPPKGLQRYGEEDDIPESADVEQHSQDQDQEAIPANNKMGMLPIIEYHPSPEGEQLRKDLYHEEKEGSYQKASEGPSNDELDDILEQRMKFELEKALQMPVDMDEFEMKKLNLQRMIPMIEHQCDEDFEADSDKIPEALDPKDGTGVQEDRRPKTTLTDLFPKTTSGLTKIEEV